MRAQYGTPPEAALAIVGLGKLGSGEMAMQSDLDLIFICDCADFAALSDGVADGAKPIAADIWFARAVRRFLSGLTAATAEGALYEVDTRLRPSGNAGALVTKLSGFIDYQQNKAWAWEHMALTRARVLGGMDDGRLADKVATHIQKVICRGHGAAEVLSGVEDMRQRLGAYQPQTGPLDIRRGAGGLVDVEFFVQAMQLVHGAAHETLRGAVAPVENLLARLRDAGVLPEDIYAKLHGATTTYLALRQIASLSLEDSEKQPPRAVQKLLLRATNEPDWGRLEDRLKRHRATVCTIMDNLAGYLTA